MATFDFKQQLELEGKARCTVIEYCRRIKLWQRYLQTRNSDLLKATTGDVLAYQRDLLADGASPRTVNVKLSTLTVFYEMAQQYRLIAQNLVPKGLYLKAPTPTTPRLSDDELARFEAWINSLQDNIRAAFWCLYGTGARVGEVANLRYHDVLMRNGAIFINIQHAKWHSDRLIPIINPQAARIVYEYKQAQGVTNAPLFHLSKHTIQTYATNFANQTGIPFHCHILRHNFATRLVEQGVPLIKIQSLLGHKTLAMTMHYVRNANSDVTQLAPIIYPKGVS